MIIYIKKSENIKLIYSILKIFKVERIENRATIYIPISSRTRKKKTEKITEKLCKYFYNNNIRNVVLDNELTQNEEVKNVLYSNNINILDGKSISKYIINNLIKKVYEYKNKKIEAGEVTLLINENDEINTKTIITLAKDIKRLNIITRNIKSFKKVVDYLYNELGILIKLSNNIKTNLKSSDIIVNIDFPEEILNKLDIPNDATILNIPENINIKAKKFSGINIKSWEIQIPEQYNVKDFNEKSIYEASFYKKPKIKIFEQIQNDNIKIEKLIGVNGQINPKEFI